MAGPVYALVGERTQCAAAGQQRERDAYGTNSACEGARKGFAQRCRRGTLTASERLTIHCSSRSVRGGSDPDPMPEANSKPVPFAPLIACAAAAGVAIGCGLVRARCGSDPAPLTDHKLSGALLVMSIAVGTGLLGTLSRSGAPLALVAGLSVAATWHHGWHGSIAFALAGLAILGLARKSAPTLMTYSVGAGALFELCRFEEIRIDGLIAAGFIPVEHAGLAQHAMAFALCGILLAWLCGMPLLRSLPTLTTFCLLSVALACSARGWL